MYMYNRFVRPTFGKRKIAEIRYSDVKEFYFSVLKDGIKANTLGKGQILRPTPNTAPLICGACYNTQPEDLLTMA